MQVACRAGLRQAVSMMLDPDLRQTLLDMAGHLAGARHDWWIIASAAVALHGADPGGVGDVDVLIDPRDAAALFAALGIASRPDRGDPLFRSEWFGRFPGCALPVEIFAGFALCEAGRWTPVVPRTRAAVMVGRALLHVPERAELKELLVRFGRPKDLIRAALL